MISYSEILNVDTSDVLIPPPDELSEAAYTNTRLDYILKSVVASDDIEMNGEESEDDENESAIDTVVQSTDLNHTTTENEPSLESRALIKGSKKNTYNSSSATHSNWKLMRVMAGAHQGWVRSVAVDPVTNKWFVTGSSDSTIKIWDLATSKLKATLTGHIMGVRSLAISKRFPYLFSGSEDKTVRCWDLERTNSEAGCQIRDYHGHVGGIYAMALHPELDLLFTGGRDSVIRVWDVRSRAEVMVLTGHRSDISSVVSELGDPQVISSSMDGTIRLWDIRKQTTSLTMTHHTKSIRSLVMHPFEMTMCSGDSNGNLKEWLLPGGQLLNEFGSAEDSKIVNTLAINPASNVLFSGYDDGKMEFYDYISGSLLQSDHSSPVAGSQQSPLYASTFDMSGLRLITCEGDKSIKIWGESNETAA
ncbi:WD40-repeat-containing domain protein [Scheffersomyces xylosifermentans]|uniref:WD40-repeat-containing domain protein n=1 Tax=Scheffersomyces xylosifermentans TaxID=1304137 RepID=UPI00315CFECB